tara:strand:- start:580 stop:1596 length:1017 start_codon:yes stop_codon:yes gene_type:complete
MTIEASASTDYEILLRAGFPYIRTLGMRRLTWYPRDFVLTNERIYSLARMESTGSIRVISLEDEDLGPFGPSWIWPSSIIQDQVTGHLYVSDEATHEITVLNTDGEEVTRWGVHGTGPGELNRPAFMAFSQSGDIWIADALNHRLQLFSKEGEFIKTFGGLGAEPGLFDTPWGIAVDNNDDVYVSDWRNDRVQKFSSDGDFIMQFGSSGTERGQLNRPAGIAVDNDGDIYVCDRGNDRVELFDRNGRYVEQFIGDATLSTMARIYILANAKVLRLRDMTDLEDQKRFRAPSAVHLDNEGNMYVADSNSHRFQVYKKESYRLNSEEVMDRPRSPHLYTV